MSKFRETSGEDEDRLFVRSVGKAFRLLEAFADTPGPMTLSQLAAAIEVDKSGAQRLAHTLGRLGYLEKAKGGFRPGRRLLERSFDYLRGQPIVSRAVPILAELRRDVGERVDLSLFDDTAMIYLVRLQSKRESFYAHLNGRRVPTYCTAGGQAVLAQLAPEAALDVVERSERVPTTPRTITSVEETMRLVAQAREAGFAIALEQVWLGEIACGAAILDERKRPVAAIHVVGSIAEWTSDDFVRRIAPLARDAARAISF
ncbi:IclR family transcriptional regulator [Methylobacterium aquaticum]|uniref:IclR family transcriptional regulator n=1 Tax=Methylobacterium aquaticum TaxID=270351 RepID=A0A0J6STI6_9HYPH|nr:IclR family transcriptional regulator [Methylobacterium aquaticum]KMO36882.1 IclR family transcriptional regulator [Methylobacterium aquaticum]